MNINQLTRIKESSIQGKGLFANKDIKKGQIVGFFKGVETSKEHIHTIWTSNTKGIRVKNKLKYANHNWNNPNCKIGGSNKEPFLKAKKDIRCGEEILWDYSVGYKYNKDFDISQPILDNNGLSVIHYTIWDSKNLKDFKRQLKFIKKHDLLKQAEAYIDSKNEFKVKLIHYICAYGTVDMIKYYKKLFKLNDKNLLSIKTEYNSNLLHMACYHNNHDMISYLLKNKHIVHSIKERVFDLLPLDWYLSNLATKEQFIVIKEWIKLSKREKDHKLLRLSNPKRDVYHIYDYLLDKKYYDFYFEILNEYPRLSICYLLRKRNPKVFNEQISNVNFDYLSEEDLYRIYKIYDLKENSKYRKKIESYFY